MSCVDPNEKLIRENFRWWLQLFTRLWCRWIIVAATIKCKNEANWDSTCRSLSCMISTDSCHVGSSRKTQLVFTGGSCQSAVKRSDLNLSITVMCYNLSIFFQKLARCKSIYLWKMTAVIGHYRVTSSQVLIFLASPFSIWRRSLSLGAKSIWEIEFVKWLVSHFSK